MKWLNKWRLILKLCFWFWSCGSFCFLLSMRIVWEKCFRIWVLRFLFICLFMGIIIVGRLYYCLVEVVKKLLIWILLFISVIDLINELLIVECFYCWVDMVWVDMVWVNMVWVLVLLVGNIVNILYGVWYLLRM